MSQSNNVPNTTQYPIRVIRILYIMFAILVLIAIPVLGYFIGNLMGIHMATSDIEQGYAYSGLLYTVYNATHNLIYNQEAQVSQGMGITEGQSDLSSLQLFGLTGGILADVAIVYLLIREYEKMD